jgi:hypothetical protein
MCDSEFPLHSEELAHLCILLQKFGEVLEKRVLRSEEIKLVVALFSVHQVCQKLTSVTGHKLCCQLHYVPTHTNTHTSTQAAHCLVMYRRTLNGSLNKHTSMPTHQHTVTLSEANIWRYNDCCSNKCTRPTHSTCSDQTTTGSPNVLNDIFYVFPQTVPQVCHKHFFQWVWGFQISRQNVHEGGKVVSPTHWLPLRPRKYSWYSFLLQAESTQGPWCGRQD